MSIIAPAEINDTHPLHPMMEAVNKYMGFQLNDGRLMAHRPDIAKSFAELTKAVLQDGAVDPGLKRMMGLISSQVAGCTYCASHTSFSAAKLGVPLRKLKEIWNFASSNQFTEKEKAVLHLAAKSGMNPSQTEESDLVRLKKYFKEVEIVEIVSVLSLYAFLNRFNSTLKTEVEEEPLAVYNKIKQ